MKGWSLGRGGPVPSPVGGLGLAPRKKNQFCAKNYAILNKFWYFFPILQQKVGGGGLSPQSWKWGELSPLFRRLWLRRVWPNLTHDLVCTVRVDVNIDECSACISYLLCAKLTVVTCCLLERHLTRNVWHGSVWTLAAPPKQHARFCTRFVSQYLIVCFVCTNSRVPTHPGKSWIFFLKIPGPGKSWKITLVLESPGNISLKVVHFSSGSNGKQAAIV